MILLRNIGVLLADIVRQARSTGQWWLPIVIVIMTVAAIVAATVKVVVPATVYVLF